MTEQFEYEMPGNESAPLIISDGHNKGKAAMKFGAMIIALVLALPELAFAESARCAEVRAGVAKYGQAAAVRWARAQGYSAAQIGAARKCLARRA
jgi:hypothetical protein